MQDAIHPLSKELIERVLDYIEIKHKRDADDVITVALEDKELGEKLYFWFYVYGGEESGLRIQCISDHAVPQSKWGEALQICNDFNLKAAHGSAFLHTIDGTDIAGIKYVASILLDSGTTEIFLGSFIGHTLTYAHHFFKEVHRVWPFYDPRGENGVIVPESNRIDKEVLQKQVVNSLHYSIMKHVLDEIGLPHEVVTDDNNRIKATLSKNDEIGGVLELTFVIIGDDKNRLNIFSWIEHLPKVAQSKWPRALVACNEFNTSALFCRGYLNIIEGRTEAPLVLKSGLYLKDGVTVAFLKSFIKLHIGEALEFFKTVHTKWKLY